MTLKRRVKQKKTKKIHPLFWSHKNLHLLHLVPIPNIQYKVSLLAELGSLGV